ncbi:MAG: DUF86 domain-containing protein [Saprospiraceae bacterium]|nr:DUF86 domain-containing protein [Saprospiraceae bacterium]
MPDGVIGEALETIQHAIELIENRFSAIHRPEDFVASESGIILMDAIAMRLQVIGEKVKTIEKKSPGLLHSYGIDVQPIVRFRDFVSHHYEDADYEILFNLCHVHLPDFKNKILQVLKDTKS